MKYTVKTMVIILTMSMLLAACTNEKETASILDAGMPNPGFLDNSTMYNGIEPANDFYHPCKDNLDDIPDSLTDLAAKEEVEAWLAAFDKEPGQYHKLSEYANIYSFIITFNIPDEEVESALGRRMLEGWVDNGLLTTKEDLEVLFSHDEAAVAKQFASEYSIVTDDCIYSPAWIYYHTVSDWNNAGITKEMIREKLAAYSRLSLSDEAMLALEEKLDTFLGEKNVFNLNHDKYADQITVRELDLNMETDMPEPNMAGDSDMLYDFYQPCMPKMDSVPGALMSLMVEGNVKEWEEAYGGVRIAHSKLGEYANVYSFICLFDIEEEDVRNALSYHTANESPGDAYGFTQKDLEVLFSKDEEAILKQFASEYSIVVKDCIYSPQWLYYHSIEDWQEAGITREMVEEKRELYGRLLLSPDAVTAFGEKLAAFLGEPDM